MKKFAAVIMLLFLLVSSCVWLSWTIYGQLNNTLLHNGNWKSSKLDLSMYVFGRDEYIDQRPALAGNRLNLAAWHGYQELVSRNEYAANRLDFDFSLEPESYFLAMFDVRDRQYSAVRISANPQFPSAVIEVAQSGEFLSKQPIGFSPSAGTWHHARLQFDRTSGETLVAVDGREIARAPGRVPDLLRFGFRGSLRSAYIDSVSAYGPGGILFYDGFSYHDPMAAGKISLFAVSVLLACAVTAFLSFRRHPDGKRALFASVVFAANVLFALTLSETVLRSYVLVMYPNPDSVFSRIKRMLSGPEAGPSPMETYARGQAGRFSRTAGKTILFVGTSQTWGAGARNSWETFANRVGVLINNRPDAAAPYRVLNAAVSGADSSILLDFYKKYWITLSPDIVVINLSNNDTDAGRFGANLNEFVRLNNERNIRTVFVLEANSPEYSPDDVNFHRVMRDVAESSHIRLLDLHAYLKSRRDTGLIWWDEVHLTSYGHELTAKFIFEGLRSLL